MMKSHLSHPTQGEEIPDSEDESLTTAGKPDEGPPMPMTTSTTNTTTTNTTKSAQAIPSALKADRKTLSASSPQAADLHEKIRQLQSSIEHTKVQLCDTLDKISASEQNRQHTASALKPSALATYSLSDLSPEQLQSLVHAQAIIDHHIKQLGKYNQLKDIAMGMLGILAEREGKTMREMMAAREIEEDD